MLFSIASARARLAWGRYIYMDDGGTFLTLIVVTVKSLPRSRIIIMNAQFGLTARDGGDKVATVDRGIVF